LVKRDEKLAIELANLDCFALLRGGVEAWNEFRRKHPAYIVMNRSNLAGEQLSSVDLHCVILMESDLRRANLSGASLERAVLRNAVLRGSDLRRANLDGADLCRADLSQADLRDASLASAFLKRANLTGADLSTARGLTMAQVSEAYGDEGTKLPHGLARPTAWTSTVREDRSLG
jgi:uncharacterized protein YjbI with pentapeptide repeats